MHYLPNGVAYVPGTSAEACAIHMLAMSKRVNIFSNSSERRMETITGHLVMNGLPDTRNALEIAMYLNAAAPGPNMMWDNDEERVHMCTLMMELQLMGRLVKDGDFIDALGLLDDKMTRKVGNGNAPFLLFGRPTFVDFLLLSYIEECRQVGREDMERVCEMKWVAAFMATMRKRAAVTLALEWDASRDFTPRICMHLQGKLEEPRTVTIGARQKPGLANL